MNKKQRSCDGQGGAQRPVLCGNKLKKTGARSARARTRGQNPLVAQYLCNISQCMYLYKCAVDHYVQYNILAFSLEYKYSLEGVVSMVLSIIKRPHFLYLEQGGQLLG